MFVSLDLSDVYWGLGLAVLVALVATPLLWVMLAPLRPWPRALGTSLGCVGVTGLCALPVALRHGMTETALFAVLGSAVVQSVLLPILPFLARKA